jgi:hypothetical protein
MWGSVAVEEFSHSLGILRTHLSLSCGGWNTPEHLWPGQGNAGPSTSLRSAQDDNFWGIDCQSEL